MEKKSQAFAQKNGFFSGQWELWASEMCLKLYFRTLTCWYVLAINTIYTDLFHVPSLLKT